VSTKKKSARKRFGKKGWSLRRGKRTFPQKVFSLSSSTDLYWEQSQKITGLTEPYPQKTFAEYNFYRSLP